RDLGGFDEREVELDGPGNAASVLEYLTRQNPAFSGWRSSLRLAVNREYVPTTHPLQEGDEVAVIPPVSGG
ncbi:MAG: MoaD/ThiS family protein, partial [Bacteroidota bacterium]